ncbi:DNA/RNA helicase [Chromobacterium sinusclupearum]|uniref:DNA/RNA helicase n=1 Tax=Chromobacterium sinusclupearum TaxID=2077146 RepID=A0A2K4MTK9_9NEIS|nr:helicase-related protein [Chromobacterium sinusclupearum]POB00310.1 DNA/RNA helicase [Chromobacterium sinusclupearum]
MTPAELRGTVIERLREDLVGPHQDDEILEGRKVRPSDVYLTGILWPIGDRMDASDDDGSSGEGEDDDTPGSSTPVGQQRPCTMGLSFCAESQNEGCEVAVNVRFATYKGERVPGEKSHTTYSKWTRRQFCITVDKIVLPIDSQETIPLLADGLDASVELHVRVKSMQSGCIATITLINRSEAPKGDRDASEALTLFQTELQIEPRTGTHIVPRPPRSSANDEDEEAGQLLYRECHEFAAGHQCSASWSSSAGFASSIRSEWIPYAAVSAVREDGHEVFQPLVMRGAFEAEALATLDDKSILARLEELPSAYTDWIYQTSQKAQTLDSENLRCIAQGHLTKCNDALERIRGGIEAMRRDPDLLMSFRLANRAMALQHSWKASSRPLGWRPFQLGFILLAAGSACKASAPDREILDLLWFPTGGGKTEAYLTIIAMLAFYRRLSVTSPDDGAGNAAVMRYTLRLLTAQQFERASALVLACELIRRGLAPGAETVLKHLGSVPFSIGLWVGGDATPNNFKDALAKRGNRGGSSAEQIEACPCCQQPVRWVYDETSEEVYPTCKSSVCLLGERFGRWPVFTVDSDIYSQRPTLLIGTIDKFALLPTREEVGDLFAFGTPQATDLIIQDELHLISGPLGTIAGVYETAFDWLLRKDGRKPKVIGSTATIRRASDQARALFDRESRQFPPPGIDYDDSGFAVAARPEDRREPRIYLGVTTAGRSAKFALQATTASLLQSSGPATGATDEERDGYATLLAYFNSLRELGGAIVQMLDDVPDAMKLYSDQRNENTRVISPPKELTSRASQKEIIEILAQLKRTAADPDCIDVVLATNMVSVGVDVARLGAMLLNGQPKTRSEYIQATSRVGRSVFPGLVVAILNAAKPRDRSHYETFLGWHSSLYRDVEATSVTPFASRARDRALHAALVTMIRHGASQMRRKPDLSLAPSSLLADVVDEIERRVLAIDKDEKTGCEEEIDALLNDWSVRNPNSYNYNKYKPNRSLLISADLSALRRATGRMRDAAWPTMNNMRSVEPTTPFRMTEVLSANPRRHSGASVDGGPTAGTGANAQPAAVPRWRNRNV